MKEVLKTGELIECVFFLVDGFLNYLTEVECLILLYYIILIILLYYIILLFYFIIFLTMREHLLKLGTVELPRDSKTRKGLA